MKAFDIYLNGQHLFTAGVGDDGVLASTVTWVFGQSRPNAGLYSRVGGVDGATGEHLEWTMPEIAMGDEVTIKVVDAGHISSETNRRAVDPAQVEAKIKRLRNQNDDAA